MSEDIRNEGDYQSAVRRMRQLLDAGGEANQDAITRLADLIQAYDRLQYPARSDEAREG